MAAIGSDVARMLPPNVHITLEVDNTQFDYIDEAAPLPATGNYTRVPNGCCFFTDYGNVAFITLVNQCSKNTMVTVEDYLAGNRIGTRIFHMESSSVRRIRVPGDLNIITNERGWEPIGDDATNWIRLWEEDWNGTKVWLSRNLSPWYYAATVYTAYKNGAKYYTATKVLEPGGPAARVAAFTPPDRGYVFLDWARFDPL